MANFFKRYILLVASALLFLSSCQEGHVAGDLLGQWRMDDSSTKYISFSGSITLIRSIGQGEVYGNFQREGDSLFVQYYSIRGIARDTAIVEKTIGFKPFTNVRLKVEALNSDRLVLSQDGQMWSFYKY